MDIKDNSLYVINAPYGAPSITYTVYNTSSGAVEKENFVSAPVDAPAGIAVHSDVFLLLLTLWLVDSLLIKLPVTLVSILRMGHS